MLKLAQKVYKSIHSFDADSECPNDTKMTNRRGKIENIKRAIRKNELRKKGLILEEEMRKVAGHKLTGHILWKVEKEPMS